MNAIKDLAEKTSLDVCYDTKSSLLREFSDSLHPEIYQVIFNNIWTPMRTVYDLRMTIKIIMLEGVNQ